MQAARQWSEGGGWCSEAMEGVLELSGSGGMGHWECSLRHERKGLMETGTQSRVHVIYCVFLIPIYPSDYPSV